MSTAGIIICMLDPGFSVSVCLYVCARREQQSTFKMCLQLDGQ